MTIWPPEKASPVGASTDGRFEGQPVLGSPGKALILSLPPARLYRAGLGRILGGLSAGLYS